MLHQAGSRGVRQVAGGNQESGQRCVEQVGCSTRSRVTHRQICKGAETRTVRQVAGGNQEAGQRRVEQKGKTCSDKGWSNAGFNKESACKLKQWQQKLTGKGETSEPRLYAPA